MIIALVTISCLLAMVNSAPTHDHQKNTSWDYYVFAQEWPFSMCHVANAHNPGSCVVPKQVNDWTIHGLWPSSYTQHEGPTFCAKIPFDESQISSIKEDMQRQWANLIPSTSDASFWDHEWSKHGTCEMEKQETGAQLHYFTQALELNKKLSIQKYLQSSSINPSKSSTYKLDEIEQAIKKVTGKSFLPHCLSLKDKDQHTFYLVDIRLCLDKNLNFIDCPGGGKQSKMAGEFLQLHTSQHGEPLPSPQECPHDKPIHYFPMESA